MSDHPDFEARAQRLLKAELKRAGVTYAQLSERHMPGGLLGNQPYDYAGNQQSAAAWLGPIVTTQHQSSDAEGYQANCEKPQNREEADLCAQTRMALASEGLIGLTLQQIRLNWWQFGAFIAALVAAIWAAIEARRAANAAENAVRLSADQSRIELRAYVALKNVEVQPIKFRNDEEGLRLLPVFENTGSTPARNVRLGISHDIFESGIDDDFDFADGPQVNDETVAIGAGHPYTNADVILSSFDLRAFFSESAPIFVWGWVEYDDVFEDTPRHRTEFCFEVRPWQLDDGTYYAECHHYRKFNNFDEDCVRPPATHGRPRTVRSAYP